MSDKTTSLTYADLTNSEKVYLFEFLFSEAARQLFESIGLTAYSAFVFPEFQKERARVEVVFTCGAGRGIWKKFDVDEFRETAWTGQYRFKIITLANMDEHGRLLSLVRSTFQASRRLLNDTEPLKFHTIQPFFMDQGTSQTIVPEDGYFETTLSFDINFSIQADAWALLTA